MQFYLKKVKKRRKMAWRVNWDKCRKIKENIKGKDKDGNAKTKRGKRQKVKGRKDFGIFLKDARRTNFELKLKTLECFFLFFLFFFQSKEV
jgi:ribosomal protein S4